MFNQIFGGTKDGALSRAMEGARGGSMGAQNSDGPLARIMERLQPQIQARAQARDQAAQNAEPEYMPQQYNAPPQYQSFAQLFNQPQFDYSQVGDIYSRGAMPNNLLNRYNSLMSNLEQQQAAMVPRQVPQQPRMPYDPRKRPIMGNSQYMNFAQLFGGGRNG
jgi:hypothetical protein